MFWHNCVGKDGNHQNENIMNNDEKKNVTKLEETTDPANISKARQQQSDPQLTELKGFIDPNEDLEPTLEDGKKSPEKAEEEYKNDKIKRNRQ